MQQETQRAGDGGRGSRRDEDEEVEDRSRGDRGDRGDRGSRRRGRKATPEGSDKSEETRTLRLKLNQLEKDKLQLTSSHNQEVCRLGVELTRLRSSVERGEAQRAELQYQLTVSRRDANQAEQLSRDRQTLTDQVSQLQQTVTELQKALEITRQAREEDQNALQQEVEECNRLIQSLNGDNQRLHQLLQEQETTLEEMEARMAELQKDTDREAELNRRQAEELKYLKDRDDRSQRDKELSDQRLKSLESNVEAERTAHLQTKFNSEIIQLRVRDLEAALTAERSGLREATSSLELLRTQFKEVERAYAVERERSSSTERALNSLQEEYEQCKSNLGIALETEKKATSDLTQRLEEEQRRHSEKHSELEQAVHRQSNTDDAFMNFRKQIMETLRQHTDTDRGPPAASAGSCSPGSCSPAEVLQLLQTALCTDRRRQQDADQRVQDLLLESQGLQEEKQTLTQLTSDQSAEVEEAQRLTVQLKEELARLQLQSSDWSTYSRRLQAELQELQEEKKKEKEEREKEAQTITEHHQDESKARLSFLYCLYQRLLAGCVLLHQPQSILGDFTWDELCGVINEQVHQLTSDLQKANDQIAQLKGVCAKKSVCVRELQRNQECVLSRLEESVRRREEAWSSQHTLTVTQLNSELQLCRSQCTSLLDQVSSLTSDLSRLRGLLSQSRRESSCFLWACLLVGGALTHTERRIRTLCEHKRLLSRRLKEREQLEEEVRRLAAALGDEDEEEEEERSSRALRRWRRAVCTLSALRTWRILGRNTSVMFRLELEGGPALGVCVCGEKTAAEEGQNTQRTDADSNREAAFTCFLRSKSVSSLILSSMTDLQAALTHTGSSPPRVMSAARSAMTRLLGHLLGQSHTESGHCVVGKADEDRLNAMSPQSHMKTLVSSLQQHFLLFSQRLHSAEVERRSLRVELANLRKAARRQENEKSSKTVPAERFHSVCSELRQALSREQEAQKLIQDQNNQLNTLRVTVDSHDTEQKDTQRTLTHNQQLLTEAHQQVSCKERSLRILGKHLSGLQREKRQLEERLRQVDGELREDGMRRDRLIGHMKAAEMSYNQLRESLIQSQRTLQAQPRSLVLPMGHLELSGTKGILGDPALASCQSLLSSFSQLSQTFISRVDWLEQEVSAHRSHVTALRSELQDACLRDNLAYTSVPEFAETSPFTDADAAEPVTLRDLSKPLPINSSPAPSKLTPVPSSPKPTKNKERKVMKKKKGRERIKVTNIKTRSGSVVLEQGK